jgi:lipopolysaccharide biosynthesis glycosyltransferase
LKKKAIVTGGTKNMAPAMGVLALNISSICPDIADELVIYHDGISITDQNKISSIFPTRFILYRNPFETVNSFDEVVTKYFSPMVFSKYECFNLLHEYSQVIWTDYDIVILKDFSSDLFSKEESLVVIPDTEMGCLLEMFKTNISELQLSGVDLTKRGICLPLFLVRDTFPDYLRFYNKCIQLTKELSAYLYLPEQCVISVLLQRDSIKYGTLPFIPYAAHPIKHKTADEVFIIHAAGQPKFWNGLKNKDWIKYYNIWVKKHHGLRFPKYKESKLILFIQLCKRTFKSNTIIMIIWNKLVKRGFNE